jgi:hypothetical protein
MTIFFTNGYKKLIINDYTLRFVCFLQTITILTLWLGQYDHFSCNEHLDVAILSIVEYNCFRVWADAISC